MKRVMVVCVAVMVAMSLSRLAVAGPSAEQGPKKMMTGTIEQLNAKQQSVTVKPTASGAQIQTQTDAKQKKPEGPMVFRVDANTKIGVKGPQKGAQGEAQGQQPGGFALLKVGQLVRVVYQEAAAAPAPEQGPKKKPIPVQTQQQEVKKPQPQQPQQPQTPPTPEAVQGAKGGGKPTQGKVQPVLMALSIDILAQTPVQQEGK